MLKKERNKKKKISGKTYQKENRNRKTSKKKNAGSLSVTHVTEKDLYGPAENSARRGWNALLSAVGDK
jgi:hypothetical protein